MAANFLIILRDTRMIIHEIRHIVVIVLFALICLFTAIISLSRDWSEQAFNLRNRRGSIAVGREEVFVTGVRFYVYRDQAPYLHLDAEQLTMNEDSGLILFFSPKGVAYTDGGNTSFDYQAGQGSYQQKQERLFLKDQVVVSNKQSQLNAEQITYDLKADRVECVGEVKTQTLHEKTGDHIFVDAERVVSKPRQGLSHYYKDVRGRIKRKKVYEENLFFNADDMQLDTNQAKVTLNGSVALRKAEFRANAQRGEIYLENYNNRLKYFVLYDDVKINERLKVKGRADTIRKAFAEKLEGIISEDLFILTGYPKVYQGPDMVKGNKIILRENNEVVEVDDASTNFLLR